VFNKRLLQTSHKVNQNRSENHKLSLSLF